MLKLLVFSYLKLFDHTNHVRRNVQFSLVNLKFLVSLCLFLNNIFDALYMNDYLFLTEEDAGSNPDAGQGVDGTFDPA